MPAKSEKQRRFMGAVMSAKKGNKKVKGVAKSTSKKMSKRKIKDFLKTETFNNVYTKLILQQ
mgnify:FL=1